MFKHLCQEIHHKPTSKRKKICFLNFIQCNKLFEYLQQHQKCKTKYTTGTASELSYLSRICTLSQNGILFLSKPRSGKQVKNNNVSEHLKLATSCYGNEYFNASLLETRNITVSNKYPSCTHMFSDIQFLNISNTPQQKISHMYNMDMYTSTLWKIGCSTFQCNSFQTVDIHPTNICYRQIKISSLKVSYIFHDNSCLTSCKNHFKINQIRFIYCCL